MGRFHRAARSGPAPVLAVLVALLAVSACGNDDPTLPGERLAVRPEEKPLSQTGSIPGLSLPAPRYNADWTHRNGTASGRITHPALAASPQLRWAVNIGEGSSKRARILTVPVVAGGLIYTIDADGQLSAVATNGGIVWRKSLVPEGQKPDSGPGGGLAEAGGVLFVTTGFGEMFALSPATGGVIWKRTLEAPVRAAPTVRDGRVYLVLRDDTAFALDARTGETRWLVQAAGGAGLLGGSSPATNGQIAALPFASGELLGVLSRNGLRVWGTAITGGRRELVRNRINDVSGDPIFDGSTVYASNQSGRTVSLDALTGERKWTMAEGSYGPAWPAGGSLFLLSDRGALVRASAVTGEVIWLTQLPQFTERRRLFRSPERGHARTHYGPVLAGGRLWVASGDGLLRAFNPADGLPLGQLALPGGAAASPVVAGGVMYVVTEDGTLAAFQ